MDANFLENLARQEQAQLYEQALCQSLQNPPSLNDSDGAELDHCPNAIPNPQVNREACSGLRLYHPLKPSNATPMQRFCTISPINEPFTPLAKTSMEQMGLAVGSLDTVKLRSDVTTILAPDLEVDDAEEAYNEHPNTIVRRECLGKVRTRHRPMMAKKRKKSDENGGREGNDKRQKPE